MHTLNLLLLASGLLVFVSVMAGMWSARLGLPFLLVFLVAGMLVGVDGPIGMRFDSAPIAASVGSAALAMILLEGGIGTRMSVVRAGLKPAALLATVGVLVTALVVGAAAMVVMRVDWRYGLLLGAIVGSTDAAAVFSLLRQSGLKLAERVSATLELESGLNDPMAVFLTVALIETIQAKAGIADTLVLLVRQVALGGAIGWGGAWLVAALLRRHAITPDHGGVACLVIVSSGMAVFAAAGLVEGSGFLAVYLFGLQLRERATDAVHAAASAIDGFAWAAQATMFLLLGLLVAPSHLLDQVGPTLAIAAVLMFVARPLAVWLCLVPLRFSNAERLFIGWVGLRGAVPIVLALFPLMQQVPDSYRYFNVVFAVVLASLLLQGTTLAWSARRLGVVEPTSALPAEQRPIQGRLALDGELPLADVFEFFHLPMPQTASPTLAHWMTDNLARDRAEGDQVQWHGANFRILSLVDGRIVRVGLTLTPDGRG
ncbi:MAG: potassium/proton antiporter [Proteobacteria bacterium]|nr:potassium/proton antiporter [Pseudomonadota bacterium]